MLLGDSVSAAPQEPAKLPGPVSSVHLQLLQQVPVQLPEEMMCEDEEKSGEETSHAFNNDISVGALCVSERVSWPRTTLETLSRWSLVGKCTEVCHTMTQPELLQRLETGQRNNN